MGIYWEYDISHVEILVWYWICSFYICRDIPSIFVGLFLRVCSVSGLLLQWYTVSYMFLWLEDVLHIDSHWFPQDHVGFVNISSGPFRLLPSECCLVLQVLATHLSDSSSSILSYCNQLLIAQLFISLWIQTMSEMVLNPPNYSKLYPKHFLRRYLDP